MDNLRGKAATGGEGHRQRATSPGRAAHQPEEPMEDSASPRVARKSDMHFVSDLLRWMDGNQRLNGADVQIGYDGCHAKVYPWDRTRELLERTVASLKKSAREVGFGNDLDATLDQLQATAWTRIREARAAVLAQSRERGAPERGEAQQR